MHEEILAGLDRLVVVVPLNDRLCTRRETMQEMEARKIIKEILEKAFIERKICYHCIKE